MNKRIVIVTDEVSNTKIFEPLLIVSLKDVSRKSKGRNGSPKKRPGS
jgi:hypothetical protein